MHKQWKERNVVGKKCPNAIDNFGLIVISEMDKDLYYWLVQVERGHRHILAIGKTLPKYILFGFTTQILDMVNLIKTRKDN